MTKAHLSDEKTPKKSQSEDKIITEDQAVNDSSDLSNVSDLQNQLGNQAVQRLLAQRSGGDGAFDLDDDTAGQINSARGGGQALDGDIQTQMGETMGQDFSEVRVHTSAEADDLNQQLNAKAFTTGQDIFFKEGAYQPQSSSGQELIAHELTHVVQQGSGAVQGGSGMTVNAPGDSFEQEADAVAQAVTTGSSAAEGGVQRQEIPEEEEQVQMQAMPEEEEAVQMQEMPQEEEELQMQAMPEEEEVALD